jgi:hypothetical protein
MKVMAELIPEPINALIAPQNRFDLIVSGKQFRSGELKGAY